MSGFTTPEPPTDVRETMETSMGQSTDAIQSSSSTIHTPPTEEQAPLESTDPSTEPMTAVMESAPTEKVEIAPPEQIASEPVSVSNTEDVLEKKGLDAHHNITSETKGSSNTEGTLEQPEADGDVEMALPKDMAGAQVEMKQVGEQNEDNRNSETQTNAPSNAEEASTVKHENITANHNDDSATRSRSSTALPSSQADKIHNEKEVLPPSKAEQNGSKASEEVDLAKRNELETTSMKQESPPIVPQKVPSSTNSIGQASSSLPEVTVQQPHSIKSTASTMAARPTEATDPPTQTAPRASSSQPSNTPASIPASIPTAAGNTTNAAAPTPAENSAVVSQRPSSSHLSVEAQGKARQEEILRLQKENEDMRLMWLSLPANDHITYYSDTEDDASSSASDVNGLAPIGAYGGMPYLSGIKSSFSTGKRKRESWMQEEERESSDSADEDADKEELSEEKRHRTGNRGNKLLKNSRWIRRGKLGLWTEAKTEKEMHDRFTSRVRAVQRAGVESLLYNAPGPKVIQEGGVMTRDMLEGSDRMLFKDANSKSLLEENLHSTSLAPALLRPILSARALLESHTLRHTFRNPHIGALSKTALDLRESEGQLSRALGRCFSAIERIDAYQDTREAEEFHVNGNNANYTEIDSQSIGVDGTNGTSDELNPSFVQLDQLFITKEGLPIPLVVAPGEEPPSDEMQPVLSVTQQRDVVRAALECLHELGADSLEYVERLDEVRGRLEAVKRRRTQVWEALRLWAVKRECGPEEDEEGEVEEGEEGIEDASSSRPVGVKPSTAAVTTTSRKRR